MSTEHVVKDGEYLSSIAVDYGFSGYKSIWDHPQNAALKAQRKNPNILSPGDILFIPDREAKVVPAATEKQHRYEVNLSPVKLRIVVRNEHGEPVANTTFKLTVEGETYTVNTDADGLLEHRIPPTAHDGNLLLQAAGSANGAEIQLKIGFLHPVEDISGVRTRLNNLGYSAGTTEDEDKSKLRSAIEEFQCDNGLTPDGECSGSLQAKLKEAHGC